MINDKTRRLLNAFMDNPHSSLLLDGGIDHGVRQITLELRNRLLSDSLKGNILTLKPDEKETISVDAIRELKTKLATKAGGGQTISRIAVIEQAELMTIEAQNALLKLLEEPSSNSLIVIESSSSKKLLTTITSRMQTIPLLPISEEQALSYCKQQNITNEECQRAYLISGGKSALFMDIVHNNDSDKYSSIQEAKHYLQSSAYDRLNKQKEYAETTALQTLLESINSIAEAALHRTHAQNWEKILIETQKAKELLENNVNVKLVFLRLSVML